MGEISSETDAATGASLTLRETKMSKPSLLILVGLILAGCQTSGNGKAIAAKAPDTGYSACRAVAADDHQRWANCMAGNAPRKLYPPATLLYTDWRD